MSEQYYNNILGNHSSLKTPFWDPISDNMKACMAQTFPNNDVPAITSSDNSNTSKLEAITELLKQTLTMREKTLLPSDRLQFTTMHALAMSYTMQNKWEDGQATYERLVVESRKALGPDSKPELGAVFNLSSVYEELGKYSQAEESYKKSLVQLEMVLGKETPQYLGAVRGLVDILCKQGKTEEAGKLLSEGERIVEGMGGPFKEEEVEAMKECSDKSRKN
jgi:tetratricopeptide (TPR) repeat protein